MAIYSITIAGVEVPVLRSSGQELVLENQLVLLVPGHIQVNKEGDDDFSINDVWDIQKALSKQTLTRTETLREETSSDDFDEPHVK